MLVCAFLSALLHTRPRVQQAPGIPCSLLEGEDVRCNATSGVSRRGNAKSHPLVITREGG
jgi:hypothetical protein